MQQGRIVEQAPSLELFRSPQHPYTRRLLAARAHHAHGSRPTRWPGMRRNPRCAVLFPGGKSM